MKFSEILTSIIKWRYLFRRPLHDRHELQRSMNQVQDDFVTIVIMLSASTDAGHDLQIFRCSFNSSETFGDLDFIFMHSQISFDLIIVERDLRSSMIRRIDFLYIFNLSINARTLPRLGLPCFRPLVGTNSGFSEWTVSRISSYLRPKRQEVEKRSLSFPFHPCFLLIVRCVYMRLHST